MPTANTIGTFLVAFIAAVVTGWVLVKIRFDLVLLKLLRQAFGALGVALEILDVEDDLFAIFNAQFFQPSAQAVGHRAKHAAHMDYTDARDFLRLRDGTRNG